MVEKNVKKLKAKKHRVMNGFNTGTRDMKLKTAYRRKKRWSAEDADHFLFKNLSNRYTFGFKEFLNILIPPDHRLSCMIRNPASVVMVHGIA